MTTLEAVQRYRPSAAWINTLSHAATQGSTRYRRDTVIDLLQRAKDTPDPVRRYRIVWDAANVVQGCKTDSAPQAMPNRDDSLFAPLNEKFQEVSRKLSSPDATLADRELVAQLQAVIEEIEESTWNTFDEFQQATRNLERYDFTSPDGRVRFVTWFKQARPYFTLDLPDDWSAARVAFLQRLEFLRDRCVGEVEGFEFDRFKTDLENDFLEQMAQPKRKDEASASGVV